MGGARCACALCNSKLPHVSSASSSPTGDAAPAAVAADAKAIRKPSRRVYVLGV